MGGRDLELLWAGAVLREELRPARPRRLHDDAPRQRPAAHVDAPVGSKRPERRDGLADELRVPGVDEDPQQRGPRSPSNVAVAQIEAEEIGVGAASGSPRPATAHPPAPPPSAAASRPPSRGWSPATRPSPATPRSARVPSRSEPVPPQHALAGTRVDSPPRSPPLHRFAQCCHEDVTKTDAYDVRGARVLQLAERVDSKSIKCGFESRPGHVVDNLSCRRGDPPDRVEPRPAAAP